MWSQFLTAILALIQRSIFSFAIRKFINLLKNLILKKGIKNGIISSGDEKPNFFILFRLIMVVLGLGLMDVCSEEDVLCHPQIQEYVPSDPLFFSKIGKKGLVSDMFTVIKVVDEFEIEYKIKMVKFCAKPSDQNLEIVNQMQTTKKFYRNLFLEKVFKKMEASYPELLESSCNVDADLKSNYFYRQAHFKDSFEDIVSGSLQQDFSKIPFKKEFLEKMNIFKKK